MQIVVNTRLLLKNKLEGIGGFVFHTLKLLTTQNPNWHFIFLFDRDYDPSFLFNDNVTPVVLTPQARHPVLFYIWFEFSVAQFLNDVKPDLFLSPDGYLSLRSSVRQLAVIHDINYMHHPQDIPWLNRWYYRHFFPKFAIKADRIVTVSEFSKSDIVKYFGVSAEKVDVVFNGVSPVFVPNTLLDTMVIKEKYTKGADYFVFVGALHPRKNIERLLKAFDGYKAKTRSATKLVIVGKKLWWTKSLEQAYESLKHKDEVVFTGRLETTELAKVVAGALALVYVSYFEGFGVPILEGFAAETAVITSNITSMPEVAGDAAHLVDPYDIGAIAEGLHKIETDLAYRKDLIEMGRKRKAAFSWEKTTALLQSSIQATIEK